jgi:isoleucyl-tRNA synthetase
VDAKVRKGFSEYDFNEVYNTLNQFCVGDLSAFYFDIRKDALYCDAPSSLRRRSARTVLDHLFNCLTAWLSPILCFTMEEAWATRGNGQESSVHLRQFPAIPAGWRDEALAKRWDRLRDIRRVVTGALELARAGKRIGSSLEAAPKLYLPSAEDRVLFENVDLSELAITSQSLIVPEDGPADAFRLPDVKGAAAVFAPADGARCERCWRVLPEVGTIAAAPDLCGRCDEALKA